MKRLWRFVKGFYLFNMAIWLLGGSFMLYPPISKLSWDHLAEMSASPPTDILERVVFYQLEKFALANMPLNWLIMGIVASAFVAFKALEIMKAKTE